MPLSFGNMNGTVELVDANVSAPLWVAFDDRRPPSMNDSVRDFFISLHCIVFCLAAVGNGLVIATLVRHRRMRTVTNVFLLNLAVSDLLLAIVCMPFTIIPVLMEEFVFGEAMCIIVRYLQGVTVSSSAFTLVAISMERYFAICRPLQARRWQVLSHSYRVISVIWVASCSLNVPLGAFHSVRVIGRARHCIDLWPGELSKKVWYSFQLLGVDLLVPLVIMTVTYSLITKSLSSDFEAIAMRATQTYETSPDKVSAPEPAAAAHVVRQTSEQQHVAKPRRKHMRLVDPEASMRSHCSQSGAASKRKVVKMLVVIVMEFFVCWTPLYVVSSWHLLDPVSASRYVASPSVTMSALRLAAYSSSCCNPITYCFMSNKFRSAFLMAFRCGGAETRVEKRLFQNTLETYCESPRKLERQLTLREENAGL